MALRAILGFTCLRIMLVAVNGCSPALLPDNTVHIRLARLQDPDSLQINRFYLKFQGASATNGIISSLRCTAVGLLGVRL